MGQKLDRYAEQILILKAQGMSVREIAKVLSTSEEKVSPSTVHNFISKQEQTNEQSKESISVGQAALLERLDNVQVCLDELKTELSQLRSASGESNRHTQRVLKEQPGKLMDCVIVMGTCNWIVTAVALQSGFLVLAAVVSGAVGAWCIWETEIRRVSLRLLVRYGR